MNPLDILFRFISNTIQGAERSFLDLLSALVPYFVPVIPAYLTFFHTTQQMRFPNWVALTAAFVVEALGIASISTAIRFYHNNKTYSSEKNRAPFWLAVFVYLFYLTIVLVVNVVLEKEAGTRNNTIILAIALFSTLSIPSGVLISIRTEFAEMLELRLNARRKPTTDDTPQPRQRKPRHASKFKTKILAMLEETYAREKRVLSPKEITSKLNLDHEKAKGFVSTFTSEWAKSKGIHR